MWEVGGNGLEGCLLVRELSEESIDALQSAGRLVEPLAPATGQSSF